jgi:hypothetical protein
MHALASLYYVIGECAYTPSGKMGPMYSGAEATMPRYKNFKLYASQFPKLIEMKFRFMTKKWGILSSPLLTRSKSNIS